MVLLEYALTARRTFWRCVCAGLCLAMTSLPAHAVRDDVLVIVNDNSVDSPQVGAYYAQQRDIDPANIVHVKVPDSYFISWDDFRHLRDQLIRFMQTSTLDDPLLTPVVCTDGEPPYYCQASMDQLRSHTRIRYLVTTRGVPTRMTVDGSTLFSPNAPTSVDNYLKYWLINYFTGDVTLNFSEREAAFGDGSGMRTVEPATDRELIVGRIDGLDLNAARALVDRALAVEGAGIYGSWYGSTKFWRWQDASTGAAIYPKSDRSVLGWRYALGLWGEDRAECADYLNFSGALAEGKAPAHCRIKFNDDADPALQSTLGVNYPAPGNSGSRQPQVVNALGFQGWLDGQATVGNFNALLNWRKDDQCTLTLCDNAADPAACRLNSSDILGELNTDCVGVADGFMGYNHSSYPLSYFTLWPTGWSGAGSGDFNSMAFPAVRSDSGFDDAFSLWFRNTDQVADPLCYPDSDFSLPASQPCPDARRLQLSQSIVLGDTPFDASNPATYQVSLRYQTISLKNATQLRVRLYVHETGAGSTLIDYGLQTLATLTPVDSGWTSATAQFTLDPLLQTGASYDRIQLVFDTAGTFSGELGIDTVSVQVLGSGVELAINGSFAAGHRQVATGDHAANFLNRLGGVAVWGSVGHHQAGGFAFANNGLESLTYFLRGLPLGDAVWFDESNNSGMLYGDPLYSPVAVRLNPVDSAEIQSGSVNLVGSTVNGRDPAQVSTDYRIDVCPGSDFYTCDQAQSWQATGISGQGGSENAPLGTLDTTLLAANDFTFRLQVNSLHTVSGRSQTLADYYVSDVNDPPVATNGSLNTDEDVAANSFLTATDAEGDALSYSIVSNGAKGTAVITNVAFGLYTYTPNSDANGADSFTFKANDGQADSSPATVSVSIAAVNDVPIANDASLAADEDVIANGSLSASDVDGDVLSYSIISNGTKGTAVITDATTGAYTYTPNPETSGVDSFSFQVNDGLVDSNLAIISVNIALINDPPVATAASISTNEDIIASGILSASDVDGDALTYSIVSNGTIGTAIVTNAATGAYSYTPNLGATGVDSFTFKVNDGLVDSNIAMVNVSIALVNVAPIANTGNLSVDEDAVANASLIAMDGDGDALTYTIVNNGSKGSAVITNASTGAYSYTPNPDATGVDSFTFKVNDGLVDSNTATVLVVIAALNDAPIASNGSLNTDEDVTASGALSASDVDGDALNYSIVTNGNKGTAAITNAATGAYTYTPNANATGVDSFTFKANDGLLDSSAATITVNLAAVNDAPVANNGALNTNEDVTANGALSASDGDGDALSYSIVTNGNKGTAAITNAVTGAYTYTPNPNATGADSFTFKVNDGLVDSNIMTVSVVITAVNDAPVANSGSLTTDEDVAANGALSAVDVEGDALSYSLIANGSKGTAVITNAATGAYTYTPNPNATGVDSFTYKVNDGLVDSNIATLSVVIAAVNDVPIASNGSLNTNEDVAANGALSASDGDGDALSYLIVTSGSKGTAVITNAATGAYTYTPNPNATGADSFTFKVNDGLLDSSAATITVNLATMNDVPIASNGSITTDEDVTASGALSASDGDGDTLSYSIVTNGNKGTAAVTNAATGAYTYTPNPNATGADSFTFKVNDGQVDSNLATVSVDITAVNDAPIANNGNLNTNEDVAASGILSASDGDGDALNYSIITNGSMGTAVISNAATGAYTYTPNPNASGVDSFTFKVNDGQIDSNTATITVNLAAVNDAPIANNGSLNTDEDMTANSALSGSDVDGDALSYSIVTNGSKGTAAITNAATGTYTYTPNPNASGGDSFTFKVNDGQVDSSTANITVNLAAVNDAPVANNGNLNTNEDVTASGALNASDGDGDALIYSLITNGSMGTVVISNAATGAYTYTPNPNATGVDSFTFKVNDGLLDSNTATITVNLATVNDAPIANNGALNTNEDVAANGALNASDGDGDALNYSLIANGSKGTAVITNAVTGAYSYTPNANATGADSFTFKVNDGQVDSNVATITVNLAAVNDVPIANNGNLNTDEDVAANGVLIAVDDDGDTLNYSLIANGSKGTAVITNAATGAYSYTPNANATGADSFTFKVNDGTVDSNTAAITVNLAAVNDVPVSNNGALNTIEDVAASGALSASDGDGDALSYLIVTSGSKGTAVIINAATGAYTYTPNVNATGADSFTFKVNDGQVDSSTATIIVNLAAVNDAPVANNGNLNTNEDVTASGALNASDGDGDALIYSLITNGSMGTVVISNAATGAYTYTPNPNATGVDSFTFKVNDGLLDSNTATITVNLVTVNDAPIANNGALNTNEDVAANGGLSAIDVEGDALNYSLITNGSKGTAVIINAATGAYSYTPNTNANGADSFTFKVNDGLGDSNVATVSVFIAAVNDAPIVINSALNTNEDVATSGALSAGDVDGDALNYSLITNGSMGTAVITNSAVGAYVYTPNPDAIGVDSFTFKVNDGQVDSNAATVSVVIAAVNDVPIANGGTLNTDEDVVVSAALNANDADGDALIYSIVTNGSKGTALITNAATGDYTYTPNPNATGADSFTFKVNDGQIDSNIVIVSVDIAAVNDVPLADNGALNTNEDVTASGALSASDGDGDALIYSIVTSGSKGTVLITNAASGAYTYTPNADATGADSFTFKANDGLIDSNVATVSVDIAAVNDAPIANNGSLNADEDVAASGALSASDGDGDALNYSLVANGSKGTAVITNTATGAYTYTPNVDASGADSFTFKVNDGRVDSNVATISVVIAALNDAPIANNGNLNTNEDVAVNGILSASDGDGDTLNYSLITNGSMGTAVITNVATGAYTYTPNPGANGVDSFTFKVNDALVDSNIATITVNLALVNNAPVSNSGSLSIDEDQVVSAALNANDVDGDALTWSIVTNGSKGTAVITNAVTGAYTYTPNPDATGVDSFTFKVNDGQVDSSTATITVNLAAVNDAPVANNGSLNIDEDQVVSAALNANDVDGDALSYSVVTNGSKGRAVITNAATGAYTYTPNPNATGIDNFTFKVNDGQVDSSTANITVNLAAVNDAPIANNGSLNTAENVAVNGAFSVNDADGDVLNFSAVTNGSQGTVMITNAATGAYTYTPNVGVTGVDSFTFKANDGLVDSNTATITVNVALVNFAPVANNGTLNAEINTEVSATLMANDGDGDTLIFSIVNNGLKGTAVITNPLTGAYTYTPDPGEFGVDSFSFKVSDGLVNSNTAIVSVNIVLINTAPVAQDAVMTADKNVVTHAVLSASDVDGDVLTYSIVTNGAKGVAVITNAETGEFIYTAEAGAVGFDSFTFKANDGRADSSTATVIVQIVDVDEPAGGFSGGLNFPIIILMSLLLGLRKRINTFVSR